MEQQFDIIPGKGLGEIEFGMSRSEVKAILGKPDEIDKEMTEDDDDLQLEIWHYDELALSLAFDKQNHWLLTSLSVSSPEYKLNNQELIGLTISEVEEKIESMQLGDDKYLEKTTDDELLMSFDETGINLWFEEDILTEIQWMSID